MHIERHPPSNLSTEDEFDLLTSSLLVELADAAHPNIIKVIGVGGGGGNAVNNMYREGIPGVNFLVCNTDAKALADSNVPHHLQLGNGLGAGGDPRVGATLAIDNIDSINEALSEKIKMVFIIAGMGGGTGTGAAPIIAHQAKQKGILTIGIVTIPFLFEGMTKIDRAIDGVEKLSKSVDAMLIINNEQLRAIYPNRTVVNAFRGADITMTNAVRSIVEIIQMRGQIILDFQDVTNCLKDGGMAIISSGIGKGERRITQAINAAITSPLLNSKDVYKASRMLINITTSPKDEYMMITSEFDELQQFISKFDSNVQIKYGLHFDPTLDDHIRITLLASGYDINDNDRDIFRGKTVQTEKDIQLSGRRNKYYNNANTSYRRPSPHIFRFSLEDLDNEEIIAAIENIPTFHRSHQELNRILQLSGPSTATIIDLTDEKL